MMILLAGSDCRTVLPSKCSASAAGGPLRRHASSLHGAGVDLLVAMAVP